MINSIPTRDGLQSNSDGLTICHVCSIPHSYVILVKNRCLGGKSETPLLPLRGSSVSGMHVYVIKTYIGTYHSCFILEGKAEANQPKSLSYEEY
jgi:hypothetical protein